VTQYEKKMARRAMATMPTGRRANDDAKRAVNTPDANSARSSNEGRDNRGTGIVKPATPLNSDAYAPSPITATTICFLN